MAFNCSRTAKWTRFSSWNNNDGAMHPRAPVAVTANVYQMKNAVKNDGTGLEITRHGNVTRFIQMGASSKGVSSRIVITDYERGGASQRTENHTWAFNATSQGIVGCGNAVTVIQLARNRFETVASWHQDKRRKNSWRCFFEWWRACNRYLLPIQEPSLVITEDPQTALARLLKANRNKSPAVCF